MIRTLKSLGVVSSLGMLFILLGGALVTKTDSGAGCGDSWPLCHGQLIPTDITPELIIELSHRLVSSVMGITILLLAIIAWRVIGHIREVKFLAFLSVFFLILQGLIGAAAVMWGQSDFVLAAHFGISLVSFASVFLLTLLIFEIDTKFDAKQLFIEKRHRLEIYLLTIFTIIVVYTGALVRHTKASLVCESWPFCTSGAHFDFASYNFYQWVQMGHRFFAGLLFIWTVLFFIKVFKNYKNSRVMYWGWIITLGLITAQVIFGALVVLNGVTYGLDSNITLIVVLFHALVITCYFGMLSYFILLASRSSRQEK